jgi:hypothetical protein
MAHKKLSRNAPWPDQADACHPGPLGEFGSERFGQNPGEDSRVHPIIDQDSPVDDASDYQ